MGNTKNPHSCCTPSRGTAVSASHHGGATERAEREPVIDTIVIPGGRPIVGTARPLIQNDGEELRKSTRLKEFRITPTVITNEQFASFANATGYVTEAERFGWSFVFWSDVPSTIPETRAVAGLEWWRRVDGANWRDINGPNTSEAIWFPEHPVVQVSWNDAQAYAEWAGGRLPSEAEWEHAARGGLGDVVYPWGEADPDDSQYFPCNIWQGWFPKLNCGADGYLTTAPARSFEPNGYGLFNVVGNVWEWTSDVFRIKSLKKPVLERLTSMQGYKIAKGGSYLCHKSYCWRYRIAARVGNSPDSTSPHMGFRVAFDQPVKVS